MPVTKAITDQDTFTGRLSLFLNASKFGFAWEIIILAVNCFSVGVFIFETYTGTYILRIVQMIIASFYLVDILIFFPVVESKWKYIISLPTLASLAIIIGVAIDVKYVRFGFLSVIRVFRSAPFLRKLFPFLDNVQLAIIRLAYTAFCVLFCAASIIQMIERLYDVDRPFHIWIYFTVVTFSTVGYGDITPTSDIGKMVDACFILLAIILIPWQVNELSQQLAKRSPYQRSYTSRGLMHHIIITGDITSVPRVRNFLQEFYHARHGKPSTRVILLHPDEPSEDMLVLLADPTYRVMVVYIKGSPRNIADLRNCRLHLRNCRAVFLWAAFDRYWEKSDEKDADTLMTGKYIERFISIYRDKGVPIFLMLLRAENKVYLTGPWLRPLDPIIEFKMYMIAMSVVCPGYSALFTQLSDARRLSVKASDTRRWIREYVDCWENCMSSAPCPMSLVGMHFTDIAIILYRVLGVVVLGVGRDEIESTATQLTAPYGESLGANSFVLVNPGRHYRLSDRDLLLFVGRDQRHDVRGYVFDPAVVAENGLSNVIEQSRVTPSMQFDHHFLSPDVIPVQRRSEGGSRKEKSKDKSPSSPPPPIYHQDTEAELELMKSTLNLKKSLMKSSLESEASLKTGGTTNNTRYTSPKKERVQLRSPQYPSLGGGRSAPFIPEVDLAKGTLKPTILDASIDDVEAIVTDLEVDSVPEFSGHIVVCGSSHGLLHFVRPLRLPAVRRLPIVILHTETITDRFWDSADDFSDIRIVKGSQLKSEDLIRAGVPRAMSVVILLAAERDHGDNLALYDWDTIATKLQIDQICAREPPPVLVEFAEPSNCFFFERNRYSASTLKPGSLPALSELFACGRVFVTSMLDCFANQVYNERSLLDITRQVWKQTVPKQLPVPQDFVGRTYGSLVEHLLVRKVICLGLYRTAPDHDLPYVMSNPYKSTLLREYDRAFVLAPQSEESVEIFGTVTANQATSAARIQSIIPSSAFLGGLSSASETLNLRPSADNSRSTVPILSVSEPIEMKEISKKP